MFLNKTITLLTLEISSGKLITGQNQILKQANNYYKKT